MGIFLYSNDEEWELAKMPPAARGSFEKPPLDPAKLFIICFFTIFAKGSIVNY
jgi:hypothetical protein